MRTDRDIESMLINILVGISMIIILVACVLLCVEAINGKKGGIDGHKEGVEADKTPRKTTIGVIGEYDHAMTDAVIEKCSNGNTYCIIKTLSDGSESFSEAVEKMIDCGCDLLISTDPSYDDEFYELSRKHPKIGFYQILGDVRPDSLKCNYHNIYTKIYQARYLAGVAAGMKIVEMIAENKVEISEAKIGYLVREDDPKSISSYTAFYLGAKSICPMVTMQVDVTRDSANDLDALSDLISNNCVIIGQHFESKEIALACERRGVINVAYESEYKDEFPDTSLISVRMNWKPFIDLVTFNTRLGRRTDGEWCGGLETESVEVFGINGKLVAPGTEEMLIAVSDSIQSGEIKVFDESNIRINGRQLSTYMVNTNDGFRFQAIRNGEFMESHVKSYPYFNIHIDGIEFKEFIKK